MIFEGQPCLEYSKPIYIWKLETLLVQNLAQFLIHIKE